MNNSISVKASRYYVKFLKESYSVPLSRTMSTESGDMMKEKDDTGDMEERFQ